MEKRFNKNVQKYFSYSYRWEVDFQLRLNMAEAFQKIAQAKLNKTKFITAFVGTSLFDLEEVLHDLGFISKDPFYTYYGSDQVDPLKPMNPLEDVVDQPFDVVFIESHKFRHKPELLEKLKKTATLVIDLERFSKQ